MPEIFENFVALQNVLTENQDFYGNDLLPMSNRSTYSPYNGSSNSQGSTSVGSPMSTSLSPLHGIDYKILNDGPREPYLTILEQPMEKFRFRYKSEMIGTHGSLVGASSTSGRKKHAPTVQLHNFPERATIRCTLVTSEETQRIPHAHRLLRREGNVDRDDPHDIIVSPENGFIASFHGMGIIHTAKKHIRDELIRKMRMEALEDVKRKNINAQLSAREEAQIRADAECLQKCVNLNSVALCFQAFFLGQNDVMIPITERIYSNTINNLKSALTGELKICRIDKNTSSCDGGEEVFMLVEKVGKKNIRIKFFELNEDDIEIWNAYGRFTELDVHHQYAIVFRTPPYRDLNITSPREVFLQLERPSDADCSEPIKFTYKPSDKVMGRKRPRTSYSSSAELSQIMSAYTNPTTDETPSFPNNESRDLSKEIKQILSDGCSPSDLLEFYSQIEFDKYGQLLGNSEECMLTSDGVSTKQPQNDAMFATSIVVESIKCMKMDPKNSKERVQELLKDRTTYGDTPLHSALRYGQREIVRYILMLISTDKDFKPLVNGQNSSGKTPLHYAVLQNQPEITKALLMLGADPNRFDDHGFSPLHTAVKIPEAGACVDALLSDSTIKIEAHNDAGWTALHLAAQAGSFHAVRSLVQAGANVNNTDMSYGRTALHIAVEGGHTEIIEFLLKKTSIDVNKRNFSGNTALHSAVVYTGARAKELCTLLIQHGADPHIQNYNRESSNAEKRKRQNSDIKVEVESEDENAEEYTGQSSFDLASNKPDILWLLVYQTNESRDDAPVCAKQEVVDDDAQTQWLNAEQKEKLSQLLQKNRGWKKLAAHLQLDQFLRPILREESSNTALLLLNYMDVNSCVSLPELQSILNQIDEKEALDYVTQILSKQS